MLPIASYNGRREIQILNSSCTLTEWVSRVYGVGTRAPAPHLVLRGVRPRGVGQHLVQVHHEVSVVLVLLGQLQRRRFPKGLRRRECLRFTY